jgi:hypothetical protein
MEKYTVVYTYRVGAYGECVVCMKHVESAFTGSALIESIEREYQIDGIVFIYSGWIDSI